VRLRVFDRRLVVVVEWGLIVVVVVVEWRELLWGSLYQERPVVGRLVAAVGGRRLSGPVRLWIVDAER